MITKHALFALLPLPLGACALQWEHTPAPQPTLQNSRLIDRPFEDAWSRAVAWFATNNLTIEKVEKPSGLITARSPNPVSPEVVDIGDLKVIRAIEDPQVFRFMQINVLLQPRSERQTDVTVSVFGSFLARARDVMSGKLHEFGGPAVTTGSVEDSLFRHVQE